MGDAQTNPARPGAQEALSDPRWALVQRVAASASFQRSRRLRDFLLFACERVIRQPGAGVSEQEVRSQVFGRSLDLDSGGDSLVRVQASQLRRRLEQFFATEGAAEPIVIDMPRGTYTPVFRPRGGAGEAGQRAQAPPGLRARWPSRALRLGHTATLAALMVACGWLYHEARRWRVPAQGGPAVLEPAVDRLWRQMFGGDSVYVVLADSNLTLLQDALHHQLTLPEYQRQRFEALAQERLPKSELPIAWRLMNRDFTSIADAQLVRRVAAVNTAQRRSMDLVLARRADASQLPSHNVILSGPRRANPWLELFESRLSFQSRFEEPTRRGWLQNTSPQVGEAAEYVAEWNKVGYCRVAYLPSLDASRTALLISGTDMSSTDAGAELVTSERRLRQLFSRLGVAPGARIPHFEVLLRARLVLSGAPSFEIVAHRVHEP